jgi:hypothetical protein
MRPVFHIALSFAAIGLMNAYAQTEVEQRQPERLPLGPLGRRSLPSGP